MEHLEVQEVLQREVQGVLLKEVQLMEVEGVVRSSRGVRWC